MESVKKNLMYNILYQVLVIVLPLITAPYLSRRLGATALGIFSYTNSIGFYFLALCMLGIANHGNRCIAAARDNKTELSKTFFEIYAIQLVLSVFSLSLYYIYCSMIVNDNREIAFLQSLYVISGLFDISWFFFGLEKFKITVTRNAIIKVVTVICVFTFVKNPEDLWIYTLIISGGTLISQLYLWRYLFCYVRFTKIELRNCVSHIKPIVLLYIPILSYSVYKLMDKIMIGVIFEYADVGIYHNAEKIVNIPMGFIAALGTVMLPRMSNLIAAGEKEKFNNLLGISVEFVTIVCSAVAFGLVGISNCFSVVYLGEDFYSCGNIIKILSVSVFFVAWANVVRTQFLIPKHRDAVYLTSTITGAVINFVFNIFLIPRFGAKGAAVGTVVAEASVMVAQMIMVRKDIAIIPHIKKYFSTIVFGALMAFVVHWIGENRGYSVVTLVIQLIVGAMIFLIMTFLIILKKKDFFYEYMLGFVNKKKVFVRNGDRSNMK